MVRHYDEFRIEPEHVLAELRKELQMNPRLARLLAVQLYNDKERILSASFRTTEHAQLIGLTQSAGVLADMITRLTANLDLL